MSAKTGALCAGLAAAFLVAGCAGNERVTLMPAAQDRPVGAVAVLDDEGKERALLNTARSQATLGANSARVRQLETLDPAYEALIGSLPRLIEPQVIQFATGSRRISQDQIDQLKALLESLGPDLSIYQIEVAGYTDSIDTAEKNEKLSKMRAAQVADLLRKEGFEIDDADVIGRGEYDAVRILGDNQESERFRVVTIKIR